MYLYFSRQIKISTHLDETWCFTEEAEAGPVTDLLELSFLVCSILLLVWSILGCFWYRLFPVPEVETEEDPVVEAPLPAPRLLLDFLLEVATVWYWLPAPLGLTIWLTEKKLSGGTWSIIWYPEKFLKFFYVKSKHVKSHHS